MQATEMDDDIIPSTVSAMTSKSSSDDSEDQDVLVYTNGEAALHHVLSEVLCQPWFGLLAKALERGGFDEIQDVLLMNQAKRDTLTFLDANDVVTPLPQVQKNMLLNVKLFSSYCEENGRPIIDWTSISKADFKSVVLYMEEEKVTIPPCTTESHANATKPRKVTSTPMVTPPPMIVF